MTKELTKDNEIIEDQIKTILQLNFDRLNNIDNLVVDNKIFVDEMKKINKQKRKDVEEALDAIIRKNLAGEEVKGVLGHKYVIGVINEQKEQRGVLEKQIQKLEKGIELKKEEVKGDKVYKEKLERSLGAKVKNQFIAIGFLFLILLYLIYRKYI